MRALATSRAGLGELLQLFVAMRQAASADVRHDLAFQITLCPASMNRLQAACSTVVKCLSDRANLRSDILQEATLFIVEWLSAESLDYEDRGLDFFGSWYWTLCLRACRRALKKCRPLEGTLIKSLYARDVLSRTPPSAIELLWNDVLQAIAQIQNPLLKSVMADMAQGINQARSGKLHGVSQSRVSQLRQEGIVLLRRSLHGDAADR
jgi:hypothetical protein